MKRMVAIIAILTVIFIGMLVRRDKMQSSNNGGITVDEINQIEEYLSKIYMWKEVTR